MKQWNLNRYDDELGTMGTEALVMGWRQNIEDAQIAHVVLLKSQEYYKGLHFSESLRFRLLCHFLLNLIPATYLKTIGDSFSRIIERSGTEAADRPAPSEQPYLFQERAEEEINYEKSISPEMAKLLIQTMLSAPVESEKQISLYSTDEEIDRF